MAPIKNIILWTVQHEGFLFSWVVTVVAHQKQQVLVTLKQNGILPTKRVARKIFGTVVYTVRTPHYVNIEIPSTIISQYWQ